MSPLSLGAIYLVGLLIAEGLRLPHRLQRWRSHESWRPAPAAIKGMGERLVMACVILGMWVLPAIYVFTDWLRPFDYALSPWLAWPAVAVFALSLILRWQSQTALGQSWSPTIELSDQHRMITRGIYARMQHPLYTSLILWAVAQPALLQNLVAGWIGPLAVALIWLIRVPAEEAMLRARFGEEYLRYASRTGRVIPK